MRNSDAAQIRLGLNPLHVKDHNFEGSAIPAWFEVVSPRPNRPSVREMSRSDVDVVRRKVLVLNVERDFAERHSAIQSLCRT